MRSFVPWIAWLLWALAPAAPAGAGVLATADSLLLEEQNTEILELYMAGDYLEGIERTRVYLDHWATARGEDSPAWCLMYANLGPLSDKYGDMEIGR